MINMTYTPSYEMYATTVQFMYIQTNVALDTPQHKRTNERNLDTEYIYN